MGGKRKQNEPAAQIDGIDRNFLFGNVWPPWSRLLVSYPYVLFILYNHHFISLFEKCDNVDVRNKIQKNTSPCRIKITANFAKRGLKRLLVALVISFLVGRG